MVHARCLLTVFFCINALTYFDRGALSASLKALENPIHTSDLKVNDKQTGWIGAIYIIGYMVSAPVFADYASRNRPFRVMTFGLSIWIFAVVLTGISNSFWPLLLARLLSGIGEASFLCVAPPVIDAIATPTNCSKWIAIYFLAIPLGFALGLSLSGFYIEHGFFSSNINWRTVFVIEGILMLPFVLFVLIIKGPDRLTCVEDIIAVESDIQNASEPLLESCSSNNNEVNDEMIVEDERMMVKVFSIISNQLYVFIVLGYSMQTFVVGGFSYYGDLFCEEALFMDATTASFLLGVVTLVSGCSGTFIGGWWLDFLRDAHNEDMHQRDVEHACFILKLCSIGAIPAAFGALLTDNIFMFFSCSFIMQLCVWSCLSPVNEAIMWCTSFSLRPLALSVSVLSIHLLGDALSPIVIGQVLSWTHHQWLWTMRIMVIWLIFSMLFWLKAHQFAQHQMKEIHLDQPSVDNADDDVDLQ